MFIRDRGLHVAVPLERGVSYSLGGARLVVRQRDSIFITGPGDNYLESRTLTWNKSRGKTLQKRPDSPCFSDGAVLLL